MGAARGQSAPTPGDRAVPVAEVPVPAAASGRAAFARTIGLTIGADGTIIKRGIHPAVQGSIVDWFASPESTQRGVDAGQTAGAAQGAAAREASSKTRVMYPAPASSTAAPATAQSMDAKSEATGSWIGSDSESEPVVGAAPATPFAGLAYEVRAVDANGSSTIVDATSHVFRSGDRFMLFVRPSLPGQMEIYNINPAGKQTRIDSAQMAAGQLSSLGPYEFAAGPGDEALRLVLAACSSPALLAATRDIVKVSAAPPMAKGGIHLGECGDKGTSIPVMHSISNVTMDGSTSFALDPVSTGEIASGSLAPREVMVVFHHR
jgi:hypothetical protein